MNVQNKVKSRTGKLVSLTMVLILMVACYSAGQYFGRSVPLGTPTFEHPASEYAYTLWNEGPIFYAKNGFTGIIDYADTNSSNVIQFCINNACAGESIFLKYATYGPFILNNSVSIIGESVYLEPPALPADPDDIPASFGGPVISVPPATDGITIPVTISGVTIKNLAIVFSGAGTGYGIYANPGFDTNGMMYCYLENLVIKGQDINHYAMWIVNFQHCHFTDIQSFGGLAFHFENDGTKNYGNSFFTELYHRCATPNTGNVIEFISTAGILNLIDINRLQTIGGGTGFHLYMQGCRNINFMGYDLEASNPDMVYLLQCIDIHFYSGLMTTAAPPGFVVHFSTASCGYTHVTSVGTNFVSSGTNDFLDAVSGAVIVSGFSISCGNGDCSYTVYTDGFATYAKNETTGLIDYYGTNSSDVIQYCINSADAGQSIFLKYGTYGPFVLNKSVSIIGEGAYATPPALPLDPDAYPSDVGGTVIEVTTANTNGITIGENITGISIKKLAIKFSGAGTGYGIYANPGQDKNGLIYSDFEDIFVYGHDGSHYAFYFVNFLHVTLTRLWSFGGPAFHFQTNSTLITYGNSIFQELYSRTLTWDGGLSLPIVEFISNNTGHSINLITVARLQIMDRATISTGPALLLQNASYITLSGLDIEAPTSTKLVKMDGSWMCKISPEDLYGGSIEHVGGTWSCGYVGGGYIDCGIYTATSTGAQDYIEQTVRLTAASVTGFMTGQWSNSGVASGVSPIAVPHGLEGTPDIVTLGANAVQPYALSWAANSTYILIYHNAAGALTVTWYAEYKP